MSDRSSRPPDWALPAWDDRAVPPRRAGAPDAPEAPDLGRTPRGTFGLRILGVGDVSKAIRGAVRADERLADLWVEGEVGRVTISSAGHAYFALKDERAQLPCMMFRDDRVRSAFEPQAGLRIVAHGRVDLFEPQGALQLYVDAIQPAGHGDLALRFEALKARLAAEGLFDAARRRPLPERPGVVAVITSPTGAVWRDVVHVLRRRWPLARVLLVACQVQGEDAPATIVTAFRRLGNWVERCDREGRPGDAPTVAILARGGGSLEDLWAFNDERVVRAIVASPVPVVCGVGHEADVTLADFAADVRAPTPSAAAELVVPDRAEIAPSIVLSRRRLDGAAERAFGTARRELEGERRALEATSPAARLAMTRERAGVLLDRATHAMERRIATARRLEERARAGLDPIVPGRIADARARLERSAAALTVLGPQGTLERGYAIVRRSADDAVVRDPADAPPGTGLRVRVAHGELPATAAER
jgi:exodeoxyribonuclease VII large subunit